MSFSFVVETYMILAEVEFLQEGHTEQQREQAAEPQQPAKRPLKPPRHISSLLWITSNYPINYRLITTLERIAYLDFFVFILSLFLLSIVIF